MRVTMGLLYRSWGFSPGASEGDRPAYSPFFTAGRRCGAYSLSKVTISGSPGAVTVPGGPHDQMLSG